jgi:hypothetical protein
MKNKCNNKLKANPIPRYFINLFIREKNKVLIEKIDISNKKKIVIIILYNIPPVDSSLILYPS